MVVRLVDSASQLSVRTDCKLKILRDTRMHIAISLHIMLLMMLEVNICACSLDAGDSVSESC